jgi:hypothetical protein
MSFFTDSPYERMMVQKPRMRREVKPPAPPKAGKCDGCTHKKDACCATTCFRDLNITQKSKEVER